MGSPTRVFSPNVSRTLLRYAGALSLVYCLQLPKPDVLVTALAVCTEIADAANVPSGPDADRRWDVSGASITVGCDSGDVYVFVCQSSSRVSGSVASAASSAVSRLDQPRPFDPAHASDQSDGMTQESLAPGPTLVVMLADVSRLALPVANVVRVSLRCIHNASPVCAGEVTAAPVACAFRLAFTHPMHIARVSHVAFCPIIRYLGVGAHDARLIV